VQLGGRRELRLTVEQKLLILYKKEGDDASLVNLNSWCDFSFFLNSWFDGAWLLRLDDPNYLSDCSVRSTKQMVPGTAEEHPPICRASDSQAKTRLSSGDSSRRFEARWAIVCCTSLKVAYLEAVVLARRPLPLSPYKAEEAGARLRG
jgi:hypothetical protein